MPHRDELSRSPLSILAEASAQFHWGTELTEVEAAARELRSIGLNPDLVRQLEAKAARMDQLRLPVQLASAA